MDVIFIETSVFARQIQALISDDSYRQLQEWIAKLPERGRVIRGSGGCRKVRWKTAGKGKRGGIRVIYYWSREGNQILMVLAYAKTTAADLTPKQIRLLGELVRKEFGSN
jgi:mRNA-degrading endonuclease RelE of RelBE toxin-antitoxin system